MALIVVFTKEHPGIIEVIKCQTFVVFKFSIAADDGKGFFRIDSIFPVEFAVEVFKFIDSGFVIFKRWRFRRRILRKT